MALREISPESQVFASHRRKNSWAEVQNAPSKAELVIRDDDVWLQLWLNALPGPSQPTKVQPFFLPHDASCCSAAADGLSIIRLCIFLGLFLFSGGDTLLSGNRA